LRWLFYPHEINAAAEAITTAADPNANIIFSQVATINPPELEGENHIITVVAAKPTVLFLQSF
jgi:hypothetical protein